MVVRHVATTARTSCVLAFCLLLMAACSEDSRSKNDITLTSPAAVELDPVAKQQETVTFHAEAQWSATCSADWLTMTPQEGGAGDNTITLTTLSMNRTHATRSGQLVITSGSVRKSVTVIQSGKFAVFGADEYTIGAEGGTLTLEFTSNLDNSDDLQLGYNPEDWIGWPERSETTRAEWQAAVKTLVVQPNTSADARSTAFCLMMMGKNGEMIGLDTCYVRQKAFTGPYESVDYSADGTITLLQQATVGRGIHIVLMGDGFSDRDIADGTYAKVMDKAVENIFSEEPIKSLRDYFTVYAVTVVSRNSGVGEDRSTAFSTVPSTTSTEIACDDQHVLDYLQLIAGLNYMNTLSVVIVNSSAYNGVTLLYTNNSTNTPAQYALALCPVIGHLESEYFRLVLTHEAVGHGLAKLGDEYGYIENGRPTNEDISRVANLHSYGWLANVDTTKDLEKVCWSDFIGDSRYQREAISAYEGGYTYLWDIYRPTRESMMKSNLSPFNAPSRRAIYNKVMELGEGRSNVSYEEFVAFDVEHQPQQWSYDVTRGAVKQSLPYFAPPVLKHLR